MAEVEYAFGDFRIDVTRCELWHGRHKVELGLTPLRILICLIAQHDRYVNIRDIEVTIGINITKENLRSNVSVICKHLGDDGRVKRFIRNDRHGGYQFIGELRPANGEGVGTHGGMLAPGSIIEAAAAAPRPIPAGTKWQRQTTDHTGVKKTEWTLSGIGTFAGRDVYLINSGGTTIFWDVATHNHIGTMNNGRVVSTAFPTEGMFSWPLILGKTWDESFRYIDYVDVGDISPVRSRYTVEDYESVTVPAGTFMALRIEGTPLLNESVTRTAWYAPVPGVAVKRIWNRDGESDYRNTSLRSVMELVYYPAA
jgi:DNA-binding winged helix-turn-helix (wHTH) protein